MDYFYILIRVYPQEVIFQILIKKPNIAIIGDSHARAMYDGLAYVLKNKGEGLLNLGGRLFLDIKTYPKGEKKEIEVYKGGIEATKFVIEEPSIKTIIMVSKGHYLTDEKWIFDNYIKTYKNIEPTYDQFTEFIFKLSKRVIFPSKWL